MTMKFRVLGGPHTERGIETGKDTSGNPVYAEVNYLRGEIVETDIDLSKKFNPKGAPSMAKFQRLADTAKPTPKKFSRFNNGDVEVAEAGEPENDDASIPNDEDDGEEFVPGHEDGDEGDGSVEGIGADTLSSMTVAELRLHAASEGIDLHGATTKAQILNKIRGTSGM